MSILKFLKLTLIAVCIFIVLVFSLMALWLAPSKIEYELKKNILNSFPQYPKALTWSRYSKKAIFPYTEIHSISFTFPGGMLHDVFNFYQSYLLAHGWQEYISPTYGQRIDNQGKTTQLEGLAEFDKKIFGTHKVIAYLRSDEDYDNGKFIKNDFSIKFEIDHVANPSEIFKARGLTEIDKSPLGLRPQIIPSSDIDQRCTFSGQYRVIKYQNLSLLTRATDMRYLQTYSNYDSRVEYFPDRSKALAWGESEKIMLLDFSTCQTAIFPPDLIFNTALFKQSLRSISPDGEFVVYEIYHGYTTPPFPGSENNYSSADAVKNGLWLYNMQNYKNSQLLKLAVDTNTDNLNISWNNGQLILSGINCPKTGCLFNLQ